MRTHRWIFSFVALLALSVSATTPPANPPGKESASVELRYPGEIALATNFSDRLKDKAFEILWSANFNSATPMQGIEWDLDLAHRRYEEARSGRYLLVTLQKPEMIETIGGTLLVKEIVIGLNGEQYADSLHTVDDDGNVVVYGKHSGMLCIELLDLVKTLPDLAADPKS